LTIPVFLYWFGLRDHRFQVSRPGTSDIVQPVLSRCGSLVRGMVRSRDLLHWVPS
jgi:hypothetical protein